MAASTVAVPLATMPARMPQGGQRFGNQRKVLSIYQVLQKRPVEHGRDRQQTFVFGTELAGRVKNSRQIHPYFFDAAARRNRYPGLGRIEMKLLCLVFALDDRLRQIG
jgi:hypothetical protein